MYSFCLKLKGSNREETSIIMGEKAGTCIGLIARQREREKTTQRRGGLIATTASESL